MREQKRGAKGIAANYITRTRAIRKLQITLKDFRRLCILKGVFPRDPKKKKFGKDKTYYHVKDINFLRHEPLLHKFRDLKAYLKKYKRAMTRREYGKADKLKSRKPEMNMDHLVRERYPTFVDALRDIDDALTMVHLFAMLPAKITKTHTGEQVQQCLRLAREWQNYVVKTNTLRKVFVSVKGIYYQAEVQGQTVTWLVPHKFSQTMPRDVDFRVMITFLEFYVTLLKFVNFRLYHDIGLKPVLDAALDQKDAGLSVVRFETLAQARAAAAREAARKAAEETAKAAAMGVHGAEQRRLLAVSTAVARAGQDIEEDSDDEDDNDSEGEDAAEQGDEAGVDDFASLEEGDALVKPVEGGEAAQVARLFAGLGFVLGRECPLDSLEMVLASGGATVRRRDDLATKEELAGKGLTHMVLDRPDVHESDRVAGRQYVQPQWVYDSFNARALLPTEPYAPGVVPPAHLSPFVDDEKEGYVPKQREVLQEWGAAGGPAKKQQDAGAEASGSDGEDSDEDSDEEDAAESDEEEEEEEADEEQTVRSKKRKAKAEEEASKEMAKIMMGKKEARLYSRMQYGINKKAEANAKLMAKRQKIEQAEAAKPKKAAGSRKRKTAEAEALASKKKKKARK